MPADLPIFGIFGHHESGKTALIEALLARLQARGLAVAVAEVHGSAIEVDRPGKDSDRLFRAGADVFMQGKDETFVRLHAGAGRPVARDIEDLARAYDLVLVEGRKRAECPKVWLLGEGETGPPPEAGECLAVLERGPGRAEAAGRLLDAFLRRQWLRTPVIGSVLIGGKSSRMGRPKHLLPAGGRTWLERTVEVLRGTVGRVVLVGAGEVPASLGDVVRVPDAPDAEGPMAGILGAMRWAPWASHLVAACDLPDLTAEAAGWLLSTRSPGVWATLPHLPGRPGPEPLLAHYDFRARALLEDLAAGGRLAPSLLAGHPKVVTPAPPADLAPAWANVNTEGDLRGRAIAAGGTEDP
jgi:molybdopterin-guanine dinucleotide biosynthesis protein MobB